MLQHAKVDFFSTLNFVSAFQGWKSMEWTKNASLDNMTIHLMGNRTKYRLKRNEIKGVQSRRDERLILKCLTLLVLRQCMSRLEILEIGLEHPVLYWCSVCILVWHIPKTACEFIVFSFLDRTMGNLRFQTQRWTIHLIACWKCIAPRKIQGSSSQQRPAYVHRHWE